MDFLTGLRMGTAASLCFFGWVMARSDQRERRIFNKHLLQLAAVLLGLYAVSAAATVAGGMGWLRGHWLSWRFFRACLVHLLVSAAAAMALWRLRIWPSGDAKLFMAVCAGLPLVVHDLEGFPYAAFVGFLVNIFIPAALYVIGEAVLVAWQTWIRHLLSFLRALPGWRARFGYLLQITGSGLLDGLRWRWETSGYGLWYYIYFGFGLLTYGLSGLGGRLRLLSTIAPYLSFLLFSAADPVIRWVRPTPLKVGVLYAATAAVFAAQPALRALLPSVLTRWSLFALAFWLYSTAVRYLSAAPAAPDKPGHGAGRPYETQAIPLTALHPWALLSESQWSIIRETDEDFYERHFRRSRFPDGLTPRQYKLIRAWCLRQEIDTVEVQNIMPFAHWILLGAVLTLVLKRNVAHMVIGGGHG